MLVDLVCLLADKLSLDSDALVAVQLLELAASSAVPARRIRGFRYTSLGGLFVKS